MGTVRNPIPTREQALENVGNAVSGLFGDPASPFHAADSPENRAVFTDAVLKSSFRGTIRLEYDPTEEDLEDWLQSFRDQDGRMRAALPADQGISFREWLEENLPETDPDAFDRPLPQFAANVRELLAASGNKPLMDVLDKIDQYEFADLLRDYAIVEIRLDVIDRRYGIAVSFASPSEAENGFSSVRKTAECLEDDPAAEEYLDNPARRKEIADTALAVFLAVNGASLAEAMDYEGGARLSEGGSQTAAGGGVPGQGSFLASVRGETESLGGAQSPVLTVLSLATPAQIYAMLHAPSLRIEPWAIIGLCGAKDGAGGPFGIRAPKSAALSGELLHDIAPARIPEDSPERKRNIGNRMFWNNAVSPCDGPIDTASCDQADFTELVRKRLEERQSDAPSP